MTGGFHSSDELSDSQDDFKEDAPIPSVETPETEEIDTAEETEKTSLEELKEEILA